MTRLVGVAMATAIVLSPMPRAWAGPGGVSIAIEPPSPEYEAEKAGRDAQATHASGKAAASTVPAGAKLEGLQRSFGAFCVQWGDKLRQRQKDNLAQVKWQTSADGSLFAEYVGYDLDHLGPQTVSHPDTTPIGKMVYVEQRLRSSGRSKDEALAAPPAVVEQTEVTELFRYDGRAWVY